VDLSGPVDADADYISIGENRFVSRKHARLIQKVSRPIEARHDATWVDVDIDEQVVVLYKGDVPIFATLGSSGIDSDPTPTGIYRVTRKKRQTTMKSDRAEDQTYAVSVPWPTYFYDGYAFHAAYWHNAFGKKKSHGCVNLAPKDALFIYEQLEPRLPPGWVAIYGHDSIQSGSVVQIRSKTDVPPPPRVQKPTANK
jgi:hypothetical protein